jgi:hypothetical protein
MSLASPSRANPFASFTSQTQAQREEEERQRLAAARAAFIAPSSGQDEGIVNVPTARLSARSQTLDVRLPTGAASTDALRRKWYTYGGAAYVQTKLQSSMRSRKAASRLRSRTRKRMVGPPLFPCL